MQSSLHLTSGLCPLGTKRPRGSRGLFSFRVRTIALLVCGCCHVVCPCLYPPPPMTFRKPFPKPFLDGVSGWPGGVQATVVPMAYLASQWTKLVFGTAAASQQQAWAGECSMAACSDAR